MFFITRLTENTNLAATIPPSEQIFNAARDNIALARPKFQELDVVAKPRGSLTFSAGAGGEEEDKGKGREDAF